MSSSPKEKVSMVLLKYHLTSFLGAFLLFQIELIMAQKLLPLYGGSFSVWGTCLMFYQVLLLFGYFYAHLLTDSAIKRRSKIHLLLLGVSLFYFPLQIASPETTSSPIYSIGILLISAIGFPFLLLSSTTIILQKWLSAHPTFHGNPYPLYSSSNLGSFLALFSYPFLIQPFCTLQFQLNCWMGLYLFYICLNLFCLPKASAQENPASNTEIQKAPPPKRIDSIIWFLVNLGTCALMVSITNIITLDLSPAPILWVFPLSAYLLSFVFVFSEKKWIPKFNLWSSILGMLSLIYMLFFNVSFLLWVPLYSFSLFVVCCFSHRLLILTKPKNPKYLSLFYLMNAFGGGCGTLLINFGMPIFLQEVPTLWVDFYLSVLILIFCFALYHFSQKKTKHQLSQRSKDIILTCFYLASSLFVLSLLWKPTLHLMMQLKLISSLRIEIDAAAIEYFWIGFRDEGPFPSLWFPIYPFGLILFCSLIVKVYSKNQHQKILILVLSIFLFPLVNLLLFFLKKGLLTTFIDIYFATLLLAISFALLYPKINQWRYKVFIKGVSKFYLTILLTFFCLPNLFFEPNEFVILAKRSFYGIYTVERGGKSKWFLHGSTVHGVQQFTKKREMFPQYYYHPFGPFSDVFQVQRKAKKVAVLGLGVGALLGYAQKGTQWDFFEIDPVVVEIAQQEYTYLKKSGSQNRVFIGDARIELQKVNQKYDLIILDVFSSDAIPAHLLTAEAMQIYLDKLAKDGILAVHFSNRYLNLLPVLRKLKEEFKLYGAYRKFEAINGIPGVDLFMFTNSLESCKKITEALHWEAVKEGSPASLWTDEKINIFDVMFH